MRLILLTILLALTVLVGVVFTIYNAERVLVDLYFYQYQLPLATVVFIALLIGVVLGFLILVAMLWRKQAEIARINKRFHALEQEVDNLRKMPIKDGH